MSVPFTVDIFFEMAVVPFLVNLEEISALDMTVRFGLPVTAPLSLEGTVR